MGAVWLRFRSEARSRWRSMFGLALLVAVVSGAAMAAAGGARRTDSAYDRFMREQNAYDALLTNYPTDEGIAVFDLDEVAALPQVAESTHAYFEWVVGFGVGTAAAADPSGDLGMRINRFDILAGRMFDPDRLDEAVVSFTLAEREGLGVGDRFPFFDPGELEGYEPTADEQRTLDEFFAKVPDGMITIVGIEASPGEFPPQFGNNGMLIHLTPAFGREFGRSLGGEALAVRLEGGPDDLAAFRAGVESLSGGLPFSLVEQPSHARHVNRSIDLQAGALWVLVALVTVAGGLVLLQVFSRQAMLDAGDNPAMRALGMSTGQLVALGALRMGAIGLCGAALGAVVAVLASPLMPTGLARIAEPDPGLAIDASILTIGGILAVAGAVALSIPGVWSTARHGRLVRRAPEPRPSRAARTVASVVSSIAVSTGVRMALEPGRGRTAVPVRTTIATAALGISALAAALVFGTSLSRLLDTPRLYGQAWDIEAVDFEGGFTEEELATVGRHADVTGVGTGEAGFDAGVEIGGRRVGLMAVRNVEGDVLPPAVGGRLPLADDEIALGMKSARATGAEIGEVVTLRYPPALAVEMRVVGNVVLPSLDAATQLGEGALVLPQAFDRFAPGLEDESAASLFVALRPGADRDAVIADLTESLGELYVFDRGAPNDIINFGRVDEMPFVLGSLLGGVALLTLGYTVATAVQRRARELAVLRALGFVGQQLSLTVLTQATVIALAGLLIGVPLGVAAGRSVWDAVARDLGIVSQPRIAASTIAAVVATAVVLANALATLPARAAARLRPVTVLRVE